MIKLCDIIKEEDGKVSFKDEKKKYHVAEVGELARNCVTEKQKSGVVVYMTPEEFNRYNYDLR